MPLVVDVRETGPGQYLTDPIRAWGSVGVGIDVVDPLEGNKLGVWRVVTSLDEAEAFRIQHDAISYDNNHNAMVSYHPFLAEYGRFLVQWRWDGNESAIYDHGPRTGWMSVAKGEHTIRLAIMDFNENEVVVTIPVVGEAPSEKAPEGGNTKVGTVEMECWGDWLAITASFPASESEAPVLLVNATTQADAFHSVSGTTWRAAYRPGPGTEHVAIEVHHPRLAPYRREAIVGVRGEKGRAYRAADLEIHTKPNSPYGVLFLTVDPADVRGQTPEAPIGQAYTIGFANSPIDEPVEITFQVPLSGVQRERVDIYRVKGNDASREGAERNGDRFTVATRGLGTFIALEDKTAPAIRKFTTAPGSKGRPKIEASVVDNLSGIDDIRLTFNDRWMLIRYDPEHNTIRWEQDHDLPSGVGELKLYTRDHAGNEREETLALSIP